MDKLTDLKREWSVLLRKTADAVEKAPLTELKKASRRYDANKHIDQLEELVIHCLENGLQFRFNTNYGSQLEEEMFDVFRIDSLSKYCATAECRYCAFIDICQWRHNSNEA